MSVFPTLPRTMSSRITCVQHRVIPCPEHIEHEVLTFTLDGLTDVLIEKTGELYNAKIGDSEFIAETAGKVIKILELLANKNHKETV